jgi:hypothetical protein
MSDDRKMSDARRRTLAHLSYLVVASATALGCKKGVSDGDGHYGGHGYDPASPPANRLEDCDSAVQNVEVTARWVETSEQESVALLRIVFPMPKGKEVHERKIVVRSDLPPQREPLVVVIGPHDCEHPNRLPFAVMVTIHLDDESHVIDAPLRVTIDKHPTWGPERRW